jgi:hypothetical protein
MNAVQRPVERRAYAQPALHRAPGFLDALLLFVFVREVFGGGGALVPCFNFYTHCAIFLNFTLLHRFRVPGG